MNNISFEQKTAFITLGDFYDFGSHEMSLGVPPMYVCNHTDLSQKRLVSDSVAH